MTSWIERAAASRPENCLFIDGAFTDAAATVAWYAEALDETYDEIAPTGAGRRPGSPASRWACSARWCPGTTPLLIATWTLAPAPAAGDSVV